MILKSAKVGTYKVGHHSDFIFNWRTRLYAGWTILKISVIKKNKKKFSVI